MPQPPRATTPSPGRDAALDNLRVCAMLLGLVTHGALPFTATGLIPFPVRDATRHPAADAVYFAVHDFRMQLFFLLAGFAAASLGAARGAGAVVRNRLTRVAIPLTLAAVTVCPLMHLLVARHTAARGVEWDPVDAGGWVGPNFHLWFLYYLLLCTAPLALLLAFGHRIPRGATRVADRAVRALVGSRWRVPLLAAAVVPVLWGMPAWWVESPVGWVPDPDVFAYYLGFFAAGAVLRRHRDLLPAVGRNWPTQLTVANTLVLPAMLGLTVSGVRAAADPPAGFVAWKVSAIVLGGAYTWLMIGGLVGLFRRYFAVSTGPWQYLAGASYWCYLAGFPVQVAFQVYFATLGYSMWAEFVVVNALTFAALLASYELVVRRTWLGTLLEGKRHATVRPGVVVEIRVPAGRNVVAPGRRVEYDKPVSPVTT
ncbi:MAG: acyltransferase [Gemmataceae bacterium]